MARENDSGQEKKKRSEDSDYEGLLSDFANIFSDEDEKSEKTRKDHDGLALSELLGEDLTLETPDEGSKESEAEHEEYADLIQDAGDKGIDDSSGLSAEDEAADEEETGIKEAEETAVEMPVSEDTVETPGEPEEDFSSIFGDLGGEDGREASEEPEGEFAMAAGESDSARDTGGEEESDEDLESLFSKLTGESEKEAAVEPEGELAPVIKESGNEKDTAISDDSERDYTSLLSEFESGEDVKISDESEDDYASILEELENREEESTEGVAEEGTAEEEAAVQEESTEELDFVGLDTGEEIAELVQKDSGGEESAEDTDFLDLDLGLDVEEEEPPVSEEEQAVIVPSPEKEENDFLGLSSVTKEEEVTAVGGGGEVSAVTEVFFDGVEMDFDDQISLVTRAEILLAQKKNDKAAELYKKVADQKGVTHWVSKRLRLFNPQSQ